MKRNLLLCLIGPTAVGKTDLSIALAKNLGTQIVSCDSRQMFREMTIGTAVPEPHQLASVQHHFIQHRSIHEYYSVYEYELEAVARLEEIFQEQEVVVLCGGSGLYLNALLYGMDDIPDPDPDIRRKLETRLKKDGLEPLRDELRLLDPEYYSEVDLNNPNRIIRGLEVCLTTGKKFSSFRIRSNRERNFEARIICLDRDRNDLFDRINRRVDVMVDHGLIEEARSLYPLRHLNALKTVGYRELFDYFDNLTDLETALELIRRNTRRYARRQLTWNRKYQNSLWLDAAEGDLLVDKILREFYSG